MEYKYPLAQDTIDHNDLHALAQWLDTVPPPQLTMGPLVKEFERKWADRLGRKYAVACNSGSSANLLKYAALKESDCRIGGEVIVPATGWATTIAPAIQLAGFKAIMCQTDPETLGLDLDDLEELLKKHHPATVIMVQVLGVPHKMDKLMKLKDEYGFILLEDCCAAVGSSWRGQYLGSFGDMSTFSTYYGHQAPSIEGGLVFTDDYQYFNLLKMLRSHGWGKDIDPGFHRQFIDRHEIDDYGDPFTFFLPGYNFRLTEPQAFLGLLQIKKLDWIISQRHQNHLAYRDRLQDLLWVQKFEDTSVISSIHFLAVTQSREERRTVYETLRVNGIESRLFTAGNLSRHPFWFKNNDQKIGGVADQLFERGFFLPNYPALQIEDVDFITGVVRQAVISFRSKEVGNAAV